MLADLTPFPDAMLGRSRCGQLGRWACDACLERLFREGTLSKAAYLQGVHAPADLVAKAEADPHWKRTA